MCQLKSSSFLFILIVCLGFSQPLQAQFPQLNRNEVEDTVANQDQIYNRPFIYLWKSTAAVGGYMEANTNYFAEDGLTDGFSMELRRFNIFIYSALGSRIKFLSELEFEHGVQEINLETAIVDLEILPALTFRGGILLPPLGQFNVNHDSPKWEFIDRPLVSETIIPSTLSEVGFGFYGKHFFKGLLLTYDVYAVNGLSGDIVLNEEGRTFTQFGKGEGLVSVDNNGMPSFTGRVALRHHKVGEFGLSYYGGPYNRFRVEGEQVEDMRWLHITALDFNTKIAKKVSLTGEFAFNAIDVREDLREMFGNKQWGGFVDISYPFLKRTMFRWENATLSANLRVERVDYNVGKFSTTGENIFDEITGLTGGISFRPWQATVIRANYRYQWFKDLLGNPAVKKAGFQFGVATYF